jgi:hypothetical protein
VPTISLEVDITTDQARKLQKWFPKWNATLDAPYATYQDAFIDILKHQVRSFIDTSQDPMIVGEEYAKADPATKTAILQLLDLD